MEAFWSLKVHKRSAQTLPIRPIFNYLRFGPNLSFKEIFCILLRKKLSRLEDSNPIFSRRYLFCNVVPIFITVFIDFIYTSPFNFILFSSDPNRPVLVLKCDQGFVGYKSATSTRLECNKATYETIVVERTDKGMVHLKGTIFY